MGWQLRQAARAITGASGRPIDNRPQVANLPNNRIVRGKRVQIEKPPERRLQPDWLPPHRHLVDLLEAGIDAIEARLHALDLHVGVAVRHDALVEIQSVLVIAGGAADLVLFLRQTADVA